MPTVFLLISSGYLSVAAARFSGRNSGVWCPHYASCVFSHPSNGAQTRMSADVGPQPGGQPPSGADACRPLRSGVRRPRGARGTCHVAFCASWETSPAEHRLVGPLDCVCFASFPPGGPWAKEMRGPQIQTSHSDLASSSARCGWRGRFRQGACGFPFFDLSWRRITVNWEQTGSQLGQEHVPPSLASASESLSPCRAPLSAPPTRYRKLRPRTTLPFVSIKSPRGFKRFKKLQHHVLVP